MEEARSNSKERIINYENISLKNMGVKMISSDLDMIDPEYILKVVEQTYGSRIQQIHKPTYIRPYPEYIDKMYHYPINFRFLNFTLFNGQGSIYVMEHICRFIFQYREATNSKFLKLRLFPNSLIGGILIWYIILPPNFV